MTTSNIVKGLKLIFAPKHTLTEIELDYIESRCNYLKTCCGMSDEQLIEALRQHQIKNELLNILYTYGKLKLSEDETLEIDNFRQGLHKSTLYNKIIACAESKQKYDSVMKMGTHSNTLTIEVVQNEFGFKTLQFTQTV